MNESMNYLSQSHNINDNNLPSRYIYVLYLYRRLVESASYRFLRSVTQPKKCINHILLLLHRHDPENNM